MVSNTSHQPLTMSWFSTKHGWHLGVEYVKLPFYPNKKKADYAPPFLSSYVNMSVLSCVFFHHLPGMLLSDASVLWTLCWEGSFSLCCSLSCGIDIALCSSLSLSQHELSIFGKAPFIWMSASSVSSTCSEFWSHISGKNPLGSIASWRLIITLLTLGSIIGKHWRIQWK